VAGMTALLSLVNVAKSFGGIQAVKDVSFDVPQGSIFSVIGPNGAGKTSVFNLISGAYRPTAGRILFEGRDLTVVPTYKLVGLGIGRTFQNLALFKEETVRENLLVGCHANIKSDVVSAALFLPRARRAETEAFERVEAIIELLDLAPVRHARVGALSYGMQKRVELGRALATRPRLLLLDEMVSGMNQEETADIARHVLHINRTLGVTIMMIEHDMAIVMDISDRIAVLNFGQKIAEGTPAEIAADPAVISAYLGQES
jgi:branched-chain amino acid transport system ATP-binding protein